jgi:CheY-like chemotaxis protein
VSSEPGTGSTFWCVLTFEKDPQPQPMAYSSALKDKTLLILDDDPINLEFYNNILHIWGCIPKITRKQEFTMAALKQAGQESNTFDILVLNEKFVSTDFFEKIKKENAFQPEHIIFITHDHNRDALKSRFKIDGCEIFSVPLQETQVYHALLRTLGEEANISSNEVTVSQEIVPMKNAQDINILVVDDNLISQQVTIKMLQKMGYKVHEANNGVEALEAMDIIAFDLVFMDCQMPEMDGYETTRRVRKDKNKQHLPIIALTANAMKGDKDLCLDAGMTDFLSKPIKAPSLAAILQKYMTVIEENKARRLKSSSG